MLLQHQTKQSQLSSQFYLWNKNLLLRVD